MYALVRYIQRYLVCTCVFQACNSKGTVGMVPENYIEAYEDVTSPVETPSADNVHPQVYQSNQHEPSEPAHTQPGKWFSPFY